LDSRIVMTMIGSFRRRLLTIAAFTVAVCVVVIAAVTVLARRSDEERAEHARENVMREVERLRATLTTMPPAARPRRQPPSHELRSGYVVVLTEIDEGSWVALAAQRALERRDVTLLEAVGDDGVPVMVAAAPLPDDAGGVVFASQRLVAGHEARALRLLVMLVAVATVVLVVSSLRTSAALERGVTALRGSLDALGKDLRAPIARPGLRELDEIAQAALALARDLAHAQEERDRLTRELGERERLAGLGRVAAGVAHEVRNPLAAMKLRADLARRSPEVTPAIATDLEEIGSEIARLDRLVSDLLVLAGRRPGHREQHDLAELVAARTALLAPWAANHGVTLEATGSGSALIDPDEIARAIDNLLRNAVEASPKGSPVEVIVRAERGGKVEIDVVDRGDGVPPERAAELFEPFFTTKPGGTGLGLALARAVAATYRGTLTYTHEDGVTRFRMTLPSGPSGIT
jgi:signal transduction histidine kinase